MKKIAYCTLLYGKPYLAAAVEALYDQVDKIVILYTDQPSQGFESKLTCPDTMQDLMKECNPFWDKVTWIQSRWTNEGEHVGAFRLFATDYDWGIRFDSDEIYTPGMVDALIEQAEETNHREYRIPILHHWQSFGKCCRDAHMPTRLSRINGGEGERYLEPRGKWWMHHMGYAQPSAYITYKLSCSAHKPEFRADWYETKWLAHATTDVHPVIFNWWNVEDYDVSKLPEVLKKHPLAGKEPIC